jgi:heptose-I-phosphate ethanolaminephosphotransferase
LWIFLAIFTFSSIYHFGLYRQLIGIPAVYAIVDTDGQEVQAFAQSAFRLDLLVLSVLGSAPLLYGLKYSFSTALGSSNGSRCTIILAGCFFAVSVLGFEKTYLLLNNSILFLPYAVADAVHEKQQILSARANISRTSPPLVSSRSSAPATHILVIGESTTWRHMSLYGYNRPTSPNLLKLRADLYVAEDACSSRGSTVPQLQELLTFATRENRSPLFGGPNLLELMKAAGFKTFWLSNQRSVGESDAWTGIFGGFADVRVFVNKLDWMTGISFDERLFWPFAEALADPAPRKFIVLHLLGAHFVYSLRYPSHFSKFVTTDGIDPRVLQKKSFLFDSLSNSSSSPIAQYNAYDNAVLHDDFIVSEFIKSIAKGSSVTLTYLSDHGEALFETPYAGGHSDGPAPKQVYQIPLLFYFSPDVRNQLSSNLDAFKRNLKKPFQSDHLIDTLLDLYQVDYPVHKGSSLFDDSYASSPRFCDSLSD